MQESSCFYPFGQKFQRKNSPKQTRIPEQGELDKKPKGGAGFSGRIMLESVTQICMWNLSLRDESHTSAGFGNYSDKAFETLLSAE